MYIKIYTVDLQRNGLITKIILNYEKQYTINYTSFLIKL